MLMGKVEGGWKVVGGWWGGRGRERVSASSARKYALTSLLVDKNTFLMVLKSGQGEFAGPIYAARLYVYVL